MIVVTGATGHYGKATIDFLLQKGIQASNITAFVRDAAKASELKGKGVVVKVGNYDDYASLLEAFRGAEKLLLISGTDVVNRGKQQENVVHAAREAGVSHILYTSFERKNETETSPIAFIAQSHIATEKHIKASGMAYTIFRNSIYTEYIPLFLGEQVTDTGVFFPAGAGKTAFATRADMAEASAKVLASEGHENKEYSFTNTEAVSFGEIAAMLSEISGKSVPYVDPSKEMFSQTLASVGVPAEIIGMSAGFAEAIRQGEFDATSTDLQNLLGRKPTTVKQYLESFYGAS